MRYYSMIGSMLALAGVSAAAAMSPIEYVPINSAGSADFSAPARHRSGKKYPHSSARQNARIARQLAAGQISFIKHGPAV